MKYSSSLLQKFITVQDSPENIAKNLILKTCEIEEIVQRKIPETIVIGKVMSCEKHPDADKLSVCQVDCGKKGKFQILCGGANVCADILVPVALPWTHFAKLGITIEPRKMRGLDSNGMICSKEEIGINEDMEKHSIRSLTEDLDDVSEKDVGTPMAEKFPWLEWFVMEVDNKSLTNRPDLTWHRWAATELHAMYDGKDIAFSTIKKRYEQFQNGNIQQVLDGSTKAKKQVISEADGLNSYLLLELNNVNIQPSSFYTRLQMIDMGALPRSNWVDFSNLFMLMSGQPIHFFDAAKVEGNVTIRNAKDKESFTDLFWATHELISTDIVIADDQKVLALAGVVWWLVSGVTEKTTHILVEIANFDPVAVRKTWTRLGLRTDAELRYEKNINPLRSVHCLLLFLDELQYYKKDLGNFEIGWLSYFVNKNLKLENNKTIEVDFKKMEQFIFGAEVKDFEKIAKNILEKLWFHVNKNNITPPIWRWPDDMNIAEDIYEEVARIYGYDKIQTLPLMSVAAHVPYTDEVSIQRKVEDVLVRNFACNQTETYPWISEKMIQEFGKDKNDFYSLQNPTNPEAPYLRDGMWYGLLAHTAKNSKFFDQFNIFDIGKIRTKGNVGKKWAKFASEMVEEDMQLWVILYQKTVAQWDNDPFLAAKQMMQTIAKELELNKMSFEKYDGAQFHPKKQLLVKIGDSVIGFIGALHPLILQNQKISETSSVVYLSLNISNVIKSLTDWTEHVYHYETLQDQILRRDLCFVVDANQDFWSVLEAVKAVNEVRDLEVFDVYQGKNIAEGKKSVAFRIKITGDGTMTSEQINEVMNKAIKAGEKAGGILRG